MLDTCRPAPRLGVPKNSLAVAAAALTARRPLRARLQSTFTSLAEAARAALEPIEPWYNWGKAGLVSVKDEAEGDGRFFEIDWFGLHLTVFYGRTPAATEVHHA